MKYQKLILKALVERKSSSDISLSSLLGKEIPKPDLTEVFNALKDLFERKYIGINRPGIILKQQADKLSNLKIFLKTEGHKYYTEQYIDKVSFLQFRKIFPWIVAVGVILAIVADWTNIFSNNNQTNTNTVNNLAVKSHDPKPFFNTDTSKLNIVISRFENNKDIAEILYNRFRDLISSEDLKMVNIQVYNDSLNLPFDKDSIVKTMKGNNIDLLIFGNFVPKGIFHNNDTSTIFYKWALKENVFESIPQVNANPPIANVLSLKEIQLGKNQELYDFLVYFSMAKITIIKDEPLTKSLEYLIKARKFKDDSQLSFLILIAKERMYFKTDEQQIINECNYIKRKFLHSPNLVCFANFTLARANKDTISILKFGEQFRTFVATTQTVNSIMASLLYKNLGETFHELKEYKKAGEIFYTMVFNQPTEINYIRYAAEMGIIAGIDLQISTLDDILRKNPSFSKVKKYLGECYYSKFLQFGSQNDLMTAQFYYPNVKNEFSLEDEKYSQSLWEEKNRKSK